MEKLIGSNLLKADQYVDAKQVLFVKEFMILFYGASWDQKSNQVAEKLNQLLTTFNKYKDEGNDIPRPKMEVLYASNDYSELECIHFLAR